MRSVYCRKGLALSSLMMLMAARRCVMSSAWIPAAARRSTPASFEFTRYRSTFRQSSRNSDFEVDGQGRRIRRRTRGESSSGSASAWDDFEPLAEEPQKSFEMPTLRRESVGRTRSRESPGRQRESLGRTRSRESTGRQRTGEGREKGPQDIKTNLRALEAAGFVHLYGLASVLNALHANRRDFTRPEDLIDLDDLPPEDLEHELRQRQRKPEAQFTPWLFVQERGSKGGRSSDKAMAAEQVEELARERNIPVAIVDKGVLNTLSGNRPHNGFVLRCGSLSFEQLSRVPHPDQDAEAPKLWLVLDEVVDPQNLGALLRSAYFLGGDRIGILVCSKNSAPPSPVVSAASSGALELATVYETSNLPRTLMSAEQDGFRVIGASSSVPRDTDASLYELNDLPSDDSRPTLLVLGSEGHGLRTLVAKHCNAFVRIPGGSQTDKDALAGVDSLNVSVTGGILLWQLLQAASR